MIGSRLCRVRVAFSVSSVRVEGPMYSKACMGPCRGIGFKAYSRLWVSASFTGFRVQRRVRS